MVWVQRALGYAAQEKWSSALQSYGEVLRLQPYDRRALLERGNIYHALSYRAEAIADWQRADAYDYFLIRGHRASEISDWNRAVIAYELATQVRPTDSRGYVFLAEAHRKKGFEARESGDLDVAISEYLLAIQAKPQDYLLYTGLGEVYARAGRIDLQAQAYRQAADHALSPYERMAHLALAYYVEGDYKAAYEMWEQASVSAPTKAEPFYRQGYIAYWRMGSGIASSRKLITQALNRDPCYRDAYVGLGVIYSQGEGVCSEALRWFENGLECFPDDVELLYNAGVSGIRCQEYVRSKGYLERALTLAPTNLKVFSSLQFLLQEK